MQMALNLLARATGNRFAQKGLEFTVRACQYLMGIGAGSRVAESGEASAFRVLKNRFKPPYCIFDVGANKGQFLQMTLANIPVQDLTIHCFEPGHATFTELMAVSGSIPNIKCNNFALGNEQGESILHYDVAGSGLASLSKRRLDHFQISFEESEVIEIDTIDNYCQRNQIHHINLLKIDIEGHELDALAGAQGMFEKKQIDLVTFEFGGGNIDTKTYFQDFWYFFSGLGMKIFRITPSGYLYRIDSYKEIDEQFRTMNYLVFFE